MNEAVRKNRPASVLPHPCSAADFDLRNVDVVQFLIVMNWLELMRAIPRWREEQKVRASEDHPL